MSALAYVIHGNSAATLERCLRSLRRFDRVLCVDSCSTDGSHQLARRHAHQVERMPWQGFGAARAFAMELARAHAPRFVFFLDSDEYLPEDQGERLAALLPGLAPGVYQVVRRNRDLTRDPAYVFHQERRVRLFPPEAARYTPGQLVHEAFPRGRYPALEIAIEHDFVRQEEDRSRKQLTYAVLWAVQHLGHTAGRWPALSRLAAHLKDAVLRGALLRGGLHAWRTSWMLSRYALFKHQLLRRLERGEFAELVQARERGQWEVLVARASALAAELAVTAPGAAASRRPSPPSPRR